VLVPMSPIITSVGVVGAKTGGSFAPTVGGYFLSACSVRSTGAMPLFLSMACIGILNSADSPIRPLSPEKSISPAFAGGPSSSTSGTLGVSALRKILPNAPKAASMAISSLVYSCPESLRSAAPRAILVGT